MVINTCEEAVAIENDNNIKSYVTEEDKPENCYGADD